MPPIRRRTTRHATRAALIVLGVGAFHPLAAQQPVYDDIQNVASLLNHVREQYVDSTVPGSLLHAAVRGILRTLDPYSHLVTADEQAVRIAIERGELGTPGLVLDDAARWITVLSVDPDGAAEAAGLEVGDRVLSVDGASVVGSDARLVELRLAGPLGSTVDLEVERQDSGGAARFDVRLTRQAAFLKSVRAARMLDDSTAYLHLTAFGTEAAVEVRTALEGLDGVRKLVLDLRGNLGGRVSSSVAIASLFLPRNALVFRTRGRRAARAEDHATTRRGPFHDLPLIVLIDEQTASAAEALAASLQDHDRALIVGRRSFGKALIQAPFALPSGDVVWLTVARVQSPSGRFIQRPYGAAAHGSPADSTRTYRTAAGRIVRGASGISPDVWVPRAPRLPPWYSQAAASHLVSEVVDSVARTLQGDDAAREEWVSGRSGWERAVDALVQRVRARGMRSGSSEDLTAVGNRLAGRVAEVRWGREARNRLVLRHDPVVRAALPRFRELSRLLATPSN